MIAILDFNLYNINISDIEWIYISSYDKVSLQNGILFKNEFQILASKALSKIVIFVRRLTQQVLTV